MELNQTLGKRWVAQAAQAVAAGVAALLFAGSAAGQAIFSSGSDDSDGALDFSDRCDGTVAATVVWDATESRDSGPNLNTQIDSPEFDRVFNFTTITVPANCTIKFRADVLGGLPIVWLASGKVTLNGTLDLEGEGGHTGAAGGVRKRSVPGPGGFSGGLGSTGLAGGDEPGHGPGGGVSACKFGNHAPQHPSNQTTANTYGNVFLLPLVGGSGGAGCVNGGGAGGGAILIASDEEITFNTAVTVEINVRGGTSQDLAGDSNEFGGAGGAIRLIAPVVSGRADLSARGGQGLFSGGFNDSRAGSNGRIRIESTTLSPNVRMLNAVARAVTLTPNTVVQSSVAVPTLRLTAIDATVNGQPQTFQVPQNPLGRFSLPDVEFPPTGAAGPVTLHIEATGAPAGTAVSIEIFNESELFRTEDTGLNVLEGAADPLTLIHTTTLPPGFSYITLFANWQ